ncbi:RagB/SusD family nutrient uptake outer membrane protein [Chondrinema litorale]|uniref:RagB/SusD family nutrient uptake outer membrane protein n=1 Tax=Chondrinema litorale TaxID=2994555 RepID=UPI0025436D0A|nr:RagB/SusD family nutrient uptake outer membrane protein [Chondrinema litorale]UZR99171.1 RagB/SusD family nutrient uptake outer membrane protein [Chondrinema litorale]
MKKIIYILIFILTFTGACNEDLLEENPPNVIYAEDLYTDYDGLEAGVNGLYSLMRYEREGLDASTDLITDMTMAGTDIIVANHGGKALSSISRNWASYSTPSTGFYENAFLWLYQIVNAANTIIASVEENSESIDWSGGDLSEEENKNLILSEAKVARAYAYRHLTYNWGDVPLSLEPSSGSSIKTNWERTAVEEVRAQIIADLAFAEPNIPEEGSSSGRITKGAVQHYLAEIYLAMNQADSALYWANQVVNNPTYALITERYGVAMAEDGIAFMDMFKAGNTNREEGNTEALWVFQFEKNKLGGGEYPIMAMHHTSRYRGGDLDLTVTADRGGYGNGRASLTQWALNNFDDANDDRGSHFAIHKYFVLRDAAGNAPYGGADPLPEGMNYGDTIFLDWSEDISTEHNGVEEWPFSRKYDWADSDDPVGNRESWYDQVYLRAADTYLLKAEAEFKLGDAQAAANTINIIRNRSNASDITAADVDIDFILDERARELMVEGPRRYTLLRTGKWAERTIMYNHNGGETINPERDILLPIPQSVLDANLTLEMRQNPNY